MTALLSRPDASVAAPPSPPIPLRRNRDFQLLWSGRAVSTLGNEVTEIAYPLIMLGVTGSAGYAGMVAAAQLVTLLLFTLPAGLIADRVNRRTIMIGSNLARAAIMGALALAAHAGHAGFAAIIGAAIASSLFAALFNPASAAAVKQLVPPAQLPDAMAQNQARMFGAELAGRPLGGWLLGLGRAVPFVFDMLTFLIGAVALLFIRTPLNGRSASSSAKKAVPDVKGMTAGLRHLFGIPRLRLLVLWGMGVNFAFGAVHLMLIATWHRQGMANAGIGALAAAIAVGGLLGALFTGRILRRVRPTPLIIGLAFGAPPLIAAIGFVPGPVPIAVICCVITFFVPALNALVLTYVVAGTPDGLQGRVSSGAGFLVSALQPLSPLLFGTVFDTGGPAAAFALMGGVTLVAALATLSRHLRNLPRPDALAAP
ncbi:MFS transporter [Phytomonospora endophytica]|uniref:Putative MFS family arabinose efflux permease n=1 Tax=Phytomonospora endophytica TaxID=714109 RepID=A0A841FKZ5_9ACTN|nr:MFS transporter [Phytomonospora endophytica]MBB6032620.1 putative MFS family arabinose efflux permease [Phytomonospora endophytica]GIG66230.1 MFS transporter [Phytomonospora endophytica]